MNDASLAALTRFREVLEHQGAPTTGPIAGKFQDPRLLQVRLIPLRYWHEINARKGPRPGLSYRMRNLTMHVLYGTKKDKYRTSPDLALIVNKDDLPRKLDILTTYFRLWHHTPMTISEFDDAEYWYTLKWPICRETGRMYAEMLYERLCALGERNLA